MELPEKLRALEQEVEMLSERYALLQNRLSPISLPLPPAEEGKAFECRTEVGHALARTTLRLRLLTAAVTEQIGALEI
jgi:hypothetical protein